MGEAGRRRARETFDWRVVIGAYQDLWGELAQIRQSAPESARREGLEPARPTRADPFHAFAGYPSRSLGPDDRIVRTEAGFDWLEIVRQSPMVTFAEESLPSDAECREMLAALTDGPRTVAELVARFPPDRQGFAFRGVVWLIKFGLVKVSR